jgi:site-specific recombinase XerC
MNPAKTNPKNDRAKRDYLIWLKEAKQRSSSTVEQVRHAIDRLETYTGFRDFGTFNKEQAIAFKRALLATKAKRSAKTVSISTVHHVLQAIKDFLGWLSGQPGYRRRIRPGDIAYLNLTAGEERQAHTTGPKPFATVDEYRVALFAMPAETEIQRRDRALFALMLLISPRDTAVVDLKLRHLSVELRRVFQDPREVRTKFRKEIVSSFYPVGNDVAAIVLDWVSFLVGEKKFMSGDPLFPKTQMRQGADFGFAIQELSRGHWANAAPIRKIYRTAFERVGLPYVNPHTIRNTLTKLGYDLKLSPIEFKAWSQNMGHDSPLTTFNSYGQLTIEQQTRIIVGIGKSAPDAGPSNDTFAESIAEKVAAKLRRG